MFEASPEDLMWTPTARAQHSRAGLRYGSAPDRREWAILEPFLPPPGPRGRKRKWTMRQIVSAIFYALRSGCPVGHAARQLPAALDGLSLVRPLVARQMGWPVRDSEMSGRSAAEDCLG